MVPEFRVRPLSLDTWPAYAALIERHKGVWGGCWCMAFHAEGIGKGKTAEDNRAAKAARVRAGTAHAALVFEGETCLGWCQYGPTAELPRIKHRRAREGLDLADPDWRITCFFVDKAARGQGVAEAALAGALALIGQAGGGVVESMPQDTEGRKVSAGFLWNAGTGMFDRAGFERVEKLGTSTWLVRKRVGGG